MDEKILKSLSSESIGKIAEVIKKATARFCQLSFEACALFSDTFILLAKMSSKFSDGWFDRVLYNANRNPKWWHLYKHAKKCRTRKKYYHMLVRQYLETL